MGHRVQGVYREALPGETCEAGEHDGESGERGVKQGWASQSWGELACACELHLCLSRLRHGDGRLYAPPQPGSDEGSRGSVTPSPSR